MLQPICIELMFQNAPIVANFPLCLHVRCHRKCKQLKNPESSQGSSPSVSAYN